MTDWNTWSRIVDAAQDPQYRDAVQGFLAQADLSAEIPAVLDEKFLAPRRAEGATGEQCAYLLSNLGFAALAAGRRESAEFAIGCGRLIAQLTAETPDLALRRRFLLAKSALIIAAITDQPHLSWEDAATQCAAYLGAIDRYVDALPAEAIESNAMAAFSFSAQLLSRIRDNLATGHYASEVSQLVAVALALANRLPPAFASRVWSNIIPGADASVVFRQAGAVAELGLQAGEDSADHAAKGLAFADELLALSRNLSVPDLGQAMRVRAELLLSSGRCAEAMEQAEALEKLSGSAFERQAIAVIARCQLKQGHPESAAEMLARISPTAGEVLANWRATWLGEAGEGHWTSRDGPSPSRDSGQDIWRLQAVAAADRRDMAGFVSWAERASGFLADSLIRDRQAWKERLRGSTGAGEAAPGLPGRQAEPAFAEPLAAAGEILSRLPDGAALLQALDTEEGILTWVARMREGELVHSVARERAGSKRLGESRANWSRAYLDSRRPDGGASTSESACADAFSGLMDEVRRTWGAPLQALLDDGISQLVLIGDDLVDIPLHAMRTGPGDERLVDRVPVSYAPSLLALAACMAREPLEPARRRGLALRSLAKPGSPVVPVLAELLETKPQRLETAEGEAFWAQAAAAEILHVDALVAHDARMPLDSVTGPGWLDLPVARLTASLDLPQCDIASNTACESALPSPLRAPGFDLSSLLLAAGARSVLASAWVPGDARVSEMLERFLQEWVKGKTPSAAFREALLRLRSEHPSLADFDWASTRIVGAP